MISSTGQEYQNTKDNIIHNPSTTSSALAKLTKYKEFSTGSLMDYVPAEHDASKDALLIPLTKKKIKIQYQSRKTLCKIRKFVKRLEDAARCLLSTEELLDTSVEFGNATTIPIQVSSLDNIKEINENLNESEKFQTSLLYEKPIVAAIPTQSDDNPLNNTTETPCTRDKYISNLIETLESLETVLKEKEIIVIVGKEQLRNKEQCWLAYGENYKSNPIEFTRYLATTIKLKKLVLREQQLLKTIFPVVARLKAQMLGIQRKFMCMEASKQHKNMHKTSLHRYISNGKLHAKLPDVITLEFLEKRRSWILNSLSDFDLQDFFVTNPEYIEALSRFQNTAAFLDALHFDGVSFVLTGALASKNSSHSELLGWMTGFAILRHWIDVNPYFFKIYFDACTFPLNMWKVLSNQLYSLTLHHLTHIELTRCAITPLILKTILRGLIRQPISVLNLGYNRVGSRGVYLLADMISRHNRHNHKTAACSNVMNEMNTTSNSLTMEQKPFIAAAEVKEETPKNNLEENKIPEDSTILVPHNLVEKKPLFFGAAITTLNLTMNDLTDDGAITLANLIALYLPQLSILDLSWNSIGRKGGIALAEAIKQRYSTLPLDKSILDVVNLEGNAIESLGATALIDSAVSHPILKHSLINHLNLNMNRIDNSIFQSLLTLFSNVVNNGQSSTHLLSSLNLQWNELSQDYLAFELAELLLKIATQYETFTISLNFMNNKITLLEETAKSVERFMTIGIHHHHSSLIKNTEEEEEED